jgi:hypothetical protein
VSKRHNQSREKTRGWRIREEDLQEFIQSNQSLIASLNSPTPNNPDAGTNADLAPANPSPYTGTDDGLSKNPEEEKPGSDPPPPPEKEIEMEVRRKSDSDEGSAKDNSDPPLPENIPDDKGKQGPDIPNPIQKQTVISIKVRSYLGKPHCRIDDIANAFTPRDESRIKRWIRDEQVIAKEAFENSKVTYYIELESLKKFFDKNNVLATFIEVANIKLRKPN